MRYLTPYIQKDLQKKMVFLGGPRQVGKTTLAQSILAAYPEQGVYFNWDYDEDRQALLQKKWLSSDRLLVFDELHKYTRWKPWLKGLYDILKERHSFFVTGSARLNIYKKGGDSLLGRYHYWRLHPFTLDEIPDGIAPEQARDRFMTLGGFPEPFLANDPTQARRWRRERFDRVLREDIRDLEKIHNIATLILFTDLLRQRVSSSIVLSSLAKDLHISPNSAKQWLSSLESMYLLFRVNPYTKNLPRAVQKPPKIYFFDNGDVMGDQGAVFENLVAATLLKRLHFWEDRDGFRYELCYLRDKEGREVDFVVVKEGQVEELIEVKFHDESISRSLRYYHERLQPKRSFQIVYHLPRPYENCGIQVMDILSYIQRFPM